MIKIAIDAMGGDFGPEPIIEGLVQEIKKEKFPPFLVVNLEKIRSQLRMDTL